VTVALLRKPRSNEGVDRFEEGVCFRPVSHPVDCRIKG
jgi:hypothetical protein